MSVFFFVFCLLVIIASAMTFKSPLKLGRGKNRFNFRIEKAHSSNTLFKFYSTNVSGSSSYLKVIG
jgi:hypothetical protein